MEFKQIELSDKALFDQYLKINQYPHSQFNFTNIYMWGDFINMKYALLDDFLCIGGNCKRLCNYMLYPLGIGDKRAVIEKMIDFYQGNFRFLVLNDEMLNELEQFFPGEFEVFDMRNSYDYVYNSEDLINLTGKKYHSKRNHINKFKQLYQYEYVKLTKETLPLCKEVEEYWIEKSDMPEEEKAHERAATYKALDNFEYLGAVGGIITVEGEPVAFSLGEMMTDDMALIHLEKAKTEFEGSYTVINNEFVKHEFAGAKWINREEDMGLPSLRKAKTSYRPVFLNEAKGANYVGK